MKKVLAFVMCVMISVSSFTLAFAANGTWIKSGSRWWYKHSDGSYTRNNWEQIIVVQLSRQKSKHFIMN